MGTHAYAASYTASPSGDKVVVVGGDRFALNVETPTSEPDSSSRMSPSILMDYAEPERKAHQGFQKAPII